MLYDSYRSYASSYRGVHPVSEREFYRALHAAGYPSRKTSGHMVRDLELVVQDDGPAATFWNGPTWDNVADAKGVTPLGYGPAYPWGNDAGAKLDALVRAYSSRGEGMTMREVAEHFGTSEDDVRATLKAANVRKGDPPFAPSRLEAEPIDDLVAEGLDAKRHAYKVKADRRERHDLQRRADSAEAELAALRADRDSLASWCSMAVQGVEPATIATPRYSDTGWAAHVPIADPHVGLQVYGKESWTGENYHTDLAADRIVDAARRAAGWVDGMRGMLGAPRVVHYSIVGDLFHALQYATVSGRPMQVDGRARRVFEKVVNAVATALSTLGQISPVEARLTDGNHDGDLVFYVATALAAYFRDVPHISVQTSYNHQCSFYEGETLHVLDHGRGWTDVSAKRVGAEAATILHEIGEMYPPHRRAKIWVGDKHSPAAAFHGRQVEVIRVPALASLDDYAQGLNYAHDFDAYVYALTERGTIGHTGRLYE